MRKLLCLITLLSFPLIAEAKHLHYEKDYQSAWCKQQNGQTEVEGFKFHWLRHTVCTRLVKQNVPLPIVKDVMTHSDIKTTMQYNHVDSLDMVNAMSVLDSYN